MKLSDMKPCAVCHGKIVPIWYVLRISIAMMKPGATNSTLGLVQHFGGMGNPGALALAEVMSPDSECAVIAGDEDPHLMTEIFICQECLLHKSLNMAQLIEEARERDAEAVST